jgi:hypothetical protein
MGVSLKLMKKKKDLAKQLEELFRQPRIKGVRREARHTCLLPRVNEKLHTLSARTGKSPSRLIAEAVSIITGYDAATGDKIK